MRFEIRITPSGNMGSKLRRSVIAGRWPTMRQASRRLLPDVRDETARLHFHLLRMGERPDRVQNARQVLLRCDHMVGTEITLKMLHRSTRGSVLLWLTEDLASCGELEFVPVGYQTLTADLQIWTMRQPQTKRSW